MSSRVKGRPSSRRNQTERGHIRSHSHSHAHSRCNSYSAQLAPSLLLRCTLYGVLRRDDGRATALGLWGRYLSRIRSISDTRFRGSRQYSVTLLRFTLTASPVAQSPPRHLPQPRPLRLRTLCLSFCPQKALSLFFTQRCVARFTQPEPSPSSLSLLLPGPVCVPPPGLGCERCERGARRRK